MGIYNNIFIGMLMVCVLVGFSLSVSAIGLTCDSGDLSTICTVSSSQTITEDVVCNDLIINNNSVLTLDSLNKVGGAGQISITCSNNLAIETGASILGDATGYTGGINGENGTGIGRGEGKYASSSNSIGGGGASYGNNGSSGYFAGYEVLPGPIYGSLTAPTDLGSGGGGAVNTKYPGNSAGGSGGGSIMLNVSGTLKIDGSVSADGNSGVSLGCSLCAATGGGGSGGSIWITTDYITGNGEITADGGDSGIYHNSGTPIGGGGSGGRIAIYYSGDITSLTISVTGGEGAWNPGGNGTVYSEMVIKNPIYNDFASDSETTNFSDVADITNVTNLTLAVTGKGRIKFSESTEINAEAQDYDTNIIIEDEFISVNTAALDESFNSSATITLEGVTCPVETITYQEGIFTSKDDIIAGGKNCELDGVCSNIQCSDSTLTFDVLHFTGFAAGADANLTTEAEAGVFYPLEPIEFTAEYINSTDGTPISGECNITFDDDTEYTMDFDSTDYNYTKSFATAGLHEYNVTCSSANFVTLEANDTKLVSSVDIPEFSVITLGLGLMVILIGLFVIRRRKEI